MLTAPLPPEFCTHIDFTDLFLVPTNAAETVLNSRRGAFPKHFKANSQKSPAIYRRDAVLAFFRDHYSEFAPERLQWLNETAFAKSATTDISASPRKPSSRNKGVTQ